MNATAKFTDDPTRDHPKPPLYTFPPLSLKLCSGSTSPPWMLIPPLPQWMAGFLPQSFATKMPPQGGHESTVCTCALRKFKVNLPKTSWLDATHCTYCLRNLPVKVLLCCCSDAFPFPLPFALPQLVLVQAALKNEATLLRKQCLHQPHAMASCETTTNTA